MSTSLSGLLKPRVHTHHEKLMGVKDPNHFSDALRTFLGSHCSSNQWLMIIGAYQLLYPALNEHARKKLNDLLKKAPRHGRAASLKDNPNACRNMSTFLKDLKQADFNEHELAKSDYFLKLKEAFNVSKHKKN